MALAVSNNLNLKLSLAQSITQKRIDQAIERLSTGKRINSAKDDVGSLVQVSRFESEIISVNSSNRTAKNAQNILDVANDTAASVQSRLLRLRELAVQSANGTTAADDRTYLNKEYQALATEIERVAQNTQWNGRDILTGSAASTSSSAVSFQVGANGAQTISVTIGDISSTGNSTFGALQSSGASGSIATTTAASAQTVATSTLTALDAAIKDISTKRADLGAVSNQLTHAVDNLSSIKINAEESRSRILDTDYAQATSELARTQIIQQAGTAMLAQANQLPQTVLALLQ